MSEQEKLNRVFTIPNILTMFRIVLIPIFIVFYLKEWFVPAIVVLALSALSDILDGWIARKFDMVTRLGKALDPVADKLSQMGLMVCLVFRFPHIIILLIFIVIKELTSGILGLVTAKKTGRVEGAEWHGKLTTVLLFSTMILHILWPSIPALVSDILIAVCFVMMAVSFTLYTIRFVRMLKEGKPETSEEA